eukprot:jgi/Hompol1/2989/HPOL_006305-RA
MLQVTEHTRLRTTLSTARSLTTGLIQLHDFTETAASDAELNPKNSSSFARDPATFTDFVRGKTNFMPFVPGGLPTMGSLEQSRVAELELQEFDDLLDLDRFERGIEFEKKESDSFDVSKMLSGDDELLSQLLQTNEEDSLSTDAIVPDESGGQSPEKDSAMSEDVDSLLPQK